MSQDLAGLDGLIFVDKPVGITSNQALGKIKWALRQRMGRKVKVGHGGTLDPFASGLLIVMVGHGTKFAEDFLHGDKEYGATLKFGEQTASGDTETEVVARSPHPESLSKVKAEAQNLVAGEYWQVPPMFSAKKVDGVALYKKARQGEVVERKAELRQILQMDIKGGSLEEGVEVLVKCSGGTYIRTLAEDLAIRCDSLAHLTALRRLESSGHRVEVALGVEELTDRILGGRDLGGAHLPLLKLLSPWPTWEVDEDEAKRIRVGQSSPLERVPVAEGDRLKVLHGGELLATLVKKGAHWAYAKVFPA